MNFFTEKFNGKTVFLDGATGSNLVKRGMPAGVCPEKWISENKDVIIGLQREYVEAGSDIIYAPTFGANSIKLAEYGLESKVNELNKLLVSYSKEAANGKALVAGDVTMCGRSLYPVGTLTFDELVECYKEQIKAIYEAGADLLVIETMMSLPETKAAVIAAKETCDLPIMVTLSFDSTQRTLYGSDPVTCAVFFEALGVDAIGANCSAGPDQMTEIIRKMHEVVSIPVIAKPNAGLPELNADNETVYSMDADTFSTCMEAIYDAGATILGGCCGTDPSYIEALHSKFAGKDSNVENNRVKALTGERRTVILNDGGYFKIIGERINPTGKKKLQADLLNGSLSMVRDFASSQEEANADILDINLGMGGIDEEDMFIKAMYEVTGLSSLPLSLDSSNCDVLEKALRLYPGRPLVNSVSMEKGKADRLFPLIKKYGAMFILLPLSDTGLPKDFNEKKSIIDTLISKAEDYGLSKNDIVVDALVTTVSANSNAANEALETIRYCSSIGLSTCCGLSNISFGLPARITVNTAFLTAAMANGLTMAIANPCQRELMSAVLATDMLLGKRGADLRYIDFCSEPVEESSVPVNGTNEVKDDSKAAFDNLFNAVIKGNIDKITELTNEALKFFTPKACLDDILMPAINKVGDLFNEGRFFLPQLISAANAMKASIEILEPLLQTEGSSEAGATVVIATVKGDIHDIGKNLVALMLKNCGYRVIDLGKDVDTDVIIAKACEYDADIIALSALMTTTMTEMRNVVIKAKEAGIKAKVIIGGAVTTEEYAASIEADGYSKDAADCVKLVNAILEENK